MAEFIVGLTGGVASGKSEVARHFEALGIIVADADLAAREAVAVGSPGLAEVVAAFGAQVLAPDGGLDRPAMRRQVFADDAARARLEAIVHPRVRALLETACKAAPGPYAIAAIPLLAEAAPRAEAVHAPPIRGCIGCWWWTCRSSFSARDCRRATASMRRLPSA